MVDQWAASFEERGLPAMWMVPGSDKVDILERRRFADGGIYTGMCVSTEKELPVGLLVEPLSTREEWVDIVATCFGMNEAGRHGLGLEGDEWHHYLARVDGRLVGGASLLISETTAGVWSLGVLPEARGQGVGRGLMAHVVNEARACGRNSLVAILMASGKAGSMCKRIGFKPVCHFRPYFQGAQLDDLEG